MCDFQAVRPQVTVYNLKGEATEENVQMPAVFRAPIRTDIVTFVHSEMRKNTRQPYAVSKKAGECYPCDEFAVILQLRTAEFSIKLVWFSLVEVESTLARKCWYTDPTRYY